MVRMAVTASVVVMILFAMTSQLRLENESRHVGTIVVMVRHNSMQQDDCTRQSSHYLRSQMLHTMTFVSNKTNSTQQLVTLQRYTN